jgi:poly-beta-1,6-N-acetyl-D-glucosamine synthase
MTPDQHETAVIIPAINEDKVIAHTLTSVLKIVPKDDIYVFDDGSTDNTREISLTHTPNVLSLPNRGKAGAVNYGLTYFNITRRYKYVFFMDADTAPQEDFLQKTLPHFKNDTQNKIVCVVGRVKGISSNWTSRYRQWEYDISHAVHKKAQAYLQSIIVVPGCATVYRSFIFDEIEFPTGTLTEDMDFTFSMHRAGYTNIVYENSAIVYTQDPQNLYDFVKQIKRWYTGFWQVVKKHNIPWLGQPLDFEAGLLALEGLYNGMLILFFIASIIPLTLTKSLSVFRLPLFLDFVLFFIPTLIWSSIQDRDVIRLFLIPHFYFLRLLSSIIFIYSFFRGFLLPNKEYSWNTNRYLTERKVGL